MNGYNHPSPSYHYVKPVVDRSPDHHCIEALSITNAKFNAGRTFEFEDDLEFCPVVSDELIQRVNYLSPYNDAVTNPPNNSTLDCYTLHSSQPYYLESPYLGSPVTRQADLRMSGRRVDGRVDYGSYRMEFAGQTSSPGPQGSPLRYLGRLNGESTAVPTGSTYYGW